jgi:ammonium transporter
VPVVDPVDIAWLLVCAVLVLFMQAGFTALESGLVRSKNSINVAIKNFANFLVASSLFWLFGFGLMFGVDAGGLFGTSSFLFESDGAFLTAFFLFQLGFIATATTLMSGAVAERMRFGGYLVLATFVAAVTYPVFGHWAWGAGSFVGRSGSDGWLKELGFVDYAGSTVVHSTGGWVALAAIIVLGPRIGRFGPGAVPIHGHDLPVTTVGVFVLWVGWYGFNGGSLYALTPDVPRVILNTTVAAAFGGLAGMALTWLRDGRPDVVTIMNASLAGLVAITASAHIMSPWKAAIVGIVAAAVMQGVTLALERLWIDDAVDAVPVHLGAGVWGTLAVGLIGDQDAFPSGAGRLEQIGIQLVGIATCFVWAFGVGYVVLSLINRRFPFRIDAAGELAGLNIAEHGATTEIADLLTDMDEHRTGDFVRPVHVEPHTEVGRIALEYNRVLTAFERRTESLQLLRRTAAAANESSSVEDALAVALGEVFRFTGWPIGHAFLVSREDPGVLLSTGIWRISDERYNAFRAATEDQPIPAGRGLAGVALEKRLPVFATSDDLIGDPAESAALTVVTLDPGSGSTTSHVIPLEGIRGSRAAEWLELGLRAGLAVPVMAGSTVVGALEFFSDEPFAVDAELLELLLSVGTQLGRVVERQRSEEARLRALIDNMPAIVYLRDLDGRFILVNRQYEEFWGLDNDAIRGKTLAETDSLVSEMTLRPDLNMGIDREVLAAGAPYEHEARLVRRGKEHVLADVRFPVRDGTGDIVAIAGIDIDVTAQKRSEAELAELLRRVETARDVATEAAASKSRFLANMSHELRTPLNAIIGFTRIVSRNSETLPERQVDNLSKVLVSAEHLLALIDEILDLSRIEAGEVTLDISETNVTDVLREVIDSLEPLVERPRVQLVVDADTALPRIVTDRDKLKQILLNLVSNAVKYTDEGTIAVRAESVDGRLRIDVSDTGVGIPAEELGRIFDEFHRADGAISPSRPGTGLGLTISRRLARTLGGDVTVESRPGVGSTFTLDLPLRPSDGDVPNREGAA